MTKHSLLHHIQAYAPIGENDFQIIQKYFEERTLKKKEILMKAGELCRYNHFIVKGCLHMYFINDKGTERTVQFAIENWWMTDVLAFQGQSPSNFYIQAVEKTTVLTISHQRHEELLRNHPILERYFRTIYQIAYGSSLMKMKYLFDFSKEEIYFHFIEHFPEFAQRVPQYLIASFLGLTPEYVSEIRAKKRS